MAGPKKGQKSKAADAARGTSPASSPVTERAKADPGDETNRRDRYQFAYGVILLIGSIRGELDYKAVWCEQHEDLLAEISENLFDAYQIKTRKPELGEWGLNDEEFWKSIARFIKLNRDYPGNLRTFKFVSNARFSDSTAKTRQYLSPVKLLDAVQHVSKWEELSDAAKNGFECLKDKIGAVPGELFAVLKKLQLVPGPPLDGFEDVLAHTHVAKLEECAALKASLLSRVREALIQRVARASSLTSDDPAQHYVALNRERHKDPLLTAKRISVEDAILTIRDVLGGSFHYLPSMASLKLGNAAEKLDTLQKKMVRGGLDYHYEMMRRRVLSAEQHLLDLVTRPDEGQQICSQLENVVLGECDDARLRASQDPEPFGAKMLIDVQDRLKRVAVGEPNRVYQQRADLLVGIAGLLTSECKVWWSQPFELKALQ
jgi:hypothetical protein